jgi:hypothetical protein
MPNIETTIYLQSNREDRYEEALRLGLSPDQLDKYVYTCHEVDIKGFIDPAGNFWATHLNDRPLLAPVEV